MLETTDLRRIARHVTGAGTAEERAATSAWIAALSERQALADDFARILAASPRTVPPSDTQAALTRFKRSITALDRAGTATDAASRWKFLPNALQLFRSLTVSAAAAVLIVAAVREIPSLHQRSRRPSPRESREYAAAIGERVSLTLSDGTQVVLAPASRLEVPYTYGSAGRSVVLHGEGNFRVVHNAGEPFSVRAGNTVTTDIGTTFDVRAYRDDPDVRVSVSEGQVSLSVAGRPSVQTLGARDVGSVDPSGVAKVTRSVDPTRFTAWINGDLVYRDAPASVVIADLWRWFAIDVEAANPALLGRRVTMHFAHDESVGQVSDVLRGLLGPQVTIRALGDPSQGSKEPAQSGGDTNGTR
jgi:transmembrane sensor